MLQDAIPSFSSSSSFEQETTWWGEGRAEHSWQKERKAQQIHKHTQKHSQKKVLALSSLLSSSSNSSSTSMVGSFFPSFLPLVLLNPFMIEEEGFSESEWESMHDLKKKPHSIIHNNKQPSSRLSIGPSCAERERDRETQRETERVWVSRTLPICFLQDKLSLWRIPLAGGRGCYEAFKQAIADANKKNSESFDLLQLCLQLLESDVCSRV